MYLANNRKRKRHMSEGMELSNQEKIKKHREQETYKYLEK